MSGATKYGADVDGAIREALVADISATVALRKLQAGTLEGIDQPVAIARSTFFYRWRLAKRELAEAAARRENPSFLDQMRVAMLDDWEDLGPEEIAEEFGWDLDHTDQILDALVERSRPK